MQTNTSRPLGKLLVKGENVTLVRGLGENTWFANIVKYPVSHAKLSKMNGIISSPNINFLTTYIVHYFLGRLLEFSRTLLWKHRDHLSSKSQQLRFVICDVVIYDQFAHCVSPLLQLLLLKCCENGQRLLYLFYWGEIRFLLWYFWLRCYSDFSSFLFLLNRGRSCNISEKKWRVGNKIMRIFQPLWISFVFCDGIEQPGNIFKMLLFHKRTFPTLTGFFILLKSIYPLHRFQQLHHRFGWLLVDLLQSFLMVVLLLKHHQTCTDIFFTGLHFG